MDILASSTARPRRGRRRDGRRVDQSWLFETDLPVRYYVPKPNVRLDLLIPTETVSHCPHKGQAEWWSVRGPADVRDDVAWSYGTPPPESQKIAGLIAFYDEKVDVYVDRVLEDRPATRFS